MGIDSNGKIQKCADRVAKLWFRKNSGDGQFVHWECGEIEDGERSRIQNEIVEAIVRAGVVPFRVLQSKEAAADFDGPFVVVQVGPCSDEWPEDERKRVFCYHGLNTEQRPTIADGSHGWMTKPSPNDPSIEPGPFIEALPMRIDAVAWQDPKEPAPGDDWHKVVVEVEDPGQLSLLTEIALALSESP